MHKRREYRQKENSSSQDSVQVQIQIHVPTLRYTCVSKGTVDSNLKFARSLRTLVGGINGGLSEQAFAPFKALPSLRSSQISGLEARSSYCGSTFCLKNELAVTSLRTDTFITIQCQERNLMTVQIEKMPYRESSKRVRKEFATSTNSATIYMHRRSK